jgi:phenylacetyl-CoA:acceptor oxidoreductase subunit 1
MRWGMLVDLRRCVGCQTCTIACKQEHALPAGVAWRFVADCEVGEYPDVRRVFLPMQCMQCSDPACVPVCPTGASRQRDDGIVWVEYSACVGCGYCAMACPYHARHLVHAPTGYFDGLTPPEAVTVQPGRHGVMTKCTFCKDRIDDGIERGLTPGVDADASPMCAVACIAGAIVFGDVSDPSSRVSRLIAETGAVPLSPECGTRPNVYYVTGEPAPAGHAPRAAIDPTQQRIEEPQAVTASRPASAHGIALGSSVLGGA